MPMNTTVKRTARGVAALAGVNVFLLLAGVPLGCYGLDLGAVSDVWYGAFALPIVAAAHSGYAPLAWSMVFLNPLIYGAMWYGAWRGFRWLVRNRDGEGSR